MARTPEQKKRKPSPRILRGMTEAEWAAYERAVAVEEYRIQKEFMARGLYQKNHQPKLDRPFSNPFMSARAIGTPAAAIV